MCTQPHICTHTCMCSRANKSLCTCTRNHTGLYEGTRPHAYAHVLVRLRACMHTHSHTLATQTNCCTLLHAHILVNALSCKNTNSCLLLRTRLCMHTCECTLVHVCVKTRRARVGTRVWPVANTHSRTQVTHPYANSNARSYANSRRLVSGFGSSTCTWT